MQNVNKIKLVKGGQSVFLAITKKDEFGIAHNMNDAIDSPAHKDFIKAMQALAPHFAILSDFLDVGDVTDIKNIDKEILKRFVIRSISLSGSDADGDRSIIITGSRIKKNKAHVNINTPLLRFVEKEETAYKFIDELEKAVEKINKEVDLYLEGKVGEDPQGDLFQGTADAKRDEKGNLKAIAGGAGMDGNPDNDGLEELGEDAMKNKLASKGAAPKKAAKKTASKKAGAKEKTEE